MYCEEKKNKKNWLNYLILILKKYIKKCIIDKNNNYYKIFLKNYNFLNIVLKMCKNHSFLKFKVLTDIACVDFLRVNSRFELNYLLLSIKFGVRFVISVEVNEYSNIQSANNVFSNSNWCEREIWDLFGVFFVNHVDLRRILTDYGFNGYPLRKDFPLNGFVEIRYDEDKQYLVYEEIELMQNLRLYDFLNPVQKKYLI